MIYTIENKYFKLEANDEGAEVWSILDKRRWASYYLAGRSRSVG